MRQGRGGYCRGMGEPQQAKQQGTPEKNRPRGRPFTGPDDPRLRQNMEMAGPEPEVPAPPGEAGDGAGAILLALRWAARNFGRRCSGGPLADLFRELLAQNPAAFRAALRQEEQALRAERRERAAGGGAEDVPPPAEAERYELMIRQMLEEIREPLPPGGGAGE